MKLSSSHHLINIGKSWPKVGAPLADYSKVPKISFHFLPVCNFLVLANLLITLENVYVDLAKITVRLTQHIIGFLQKTPHQLPGAGHGRINHNDKILYPADLFCLQWLH